MSFGSNHKVRLISIENMNKQNKRKNQMDKVEAKSKHLLEQVVAGLMKIVFSKKHHYHDGFCTVDSGHHRIPEEEGQKDCMQDGEDLNN